MPIIFLIGLAFTPLSAHALSISPESIAALCGVIPCGAVGGGAEGLSAHVFARIVTALEVGIIAAAIINLFVAAAQMVALSSEESTVKDSRNAYIHIITGLAIIGLARWFALAFSPANTGIALVNTGVVEEGVSNIVVYFKMIIAITLTVNIVIQAFRLISSQGQEEQVKKARERFIAGFIGAGVILLANVIATSIVPGYGGSSALALEIAGFANYLLTILGFLALLAIIAAGVLLIVSVDEGLKDKAKNIVKTAIVALIVVLVSYAFVTAFILI